MKQNNKNMTLYLQSWIYWWPKSLNGCLVRRKPVGTAQPGHLWQKPRLQIHTRGFRIKTVACHSDFRWNRGRYAVDIQMSPTAEDDWREGAAGDPQVVGIFLCNELLHVQIPQTQVPIGGTGQEHLTARAKGAGYQRGVTDGSSPSQIRADTLKTFWANKIDVTTIISYLCGLFTWAVVWRENPTVP